MSRSILSVTVALALAAALGVSVPAASAAPAPSCAEGPVRVGGTTWGTPCADVIYAPPGIATVRAGGGDDTIVPLPGAAAVESCPGGCFLGVGSQTFEGGPGDDVVYGQRGNDTLNGGEGDDRLFGGIGDDLLRGGPGDDRLSGGFGADSIDGQAGNDYVRGDGTIDRIYDSGGGTDTLSFSTGVTPGFGDPVAVTGFPPSGGERGVQLDLGAPGQNADDGVASFGGGVDEVEGGSFETVVGTPFSDYIVGTERAETFYGGGGADVILGGGGADAIQGGADVDNVDSGDGSVAPREPREVSVGFMADQPGGAQLYLVGSDAADQVTATYSAAAVSFALSGSTFDQDPTAQAGCTLDDVTATTATCPLAAPLDSVLIAGMAGDDTLAAPGFPSTAGIVLLGGADDDDLGGGESSEDVLVDGPEGGADVLQALGGDDALLHNGGADDLFGGNGNDLFLSVSICDGEALDGGEGRDNSSWARLQGDEVGARLDQGLVGRPGAGDAAVCGSEASDTLASIEDLEGSNQHDVFYGDAGPNQLLGHAGPDTYMAQAGSDVILANSGDADPVIDCGADVDSAIIDRPQYGDAAPVNCETMREADPNSFQNATLLPPPPLAEAPPSPAPRARPDRKPPRTKLTFRPAALLLANHARRRVVFRFASNEAGSSFRCRIDRRPWRPCVSPRAFTVGVGVHAVRIFAVDPAGNRDRTPATVRFRVRRGGG